jgi:hypothetical protein
MGFTNTKEYHSTALPWVCRIVTRRILGQNFEPL